MPRISDAALRGRIGGYSTHARHGRDTAVAARAAFRDKFAHQVDPEGVLDPAERADRATMAMREHMARLALRSAVARRRRMRRRSDPSTPE